MHSSISAVIFLVCLGLVSLPQTISARAGGITQTTFFSTDSGFSGAASSSFIGPDGIKKGECSYTNKNGRFVTIKFDESREGKVNARSESSDVSDVYAELKICQAEVAKLQNLQQENFAGQHRQFLRQMSEFNKKMEEQARMFQERFGGQYQGQQSFNPFGFPFF